MTLWDKHLLTKPTRCEFFKQEVKFLGHVVIRDGILPNPEKVKAIVDMPHPYNQKEISTFLGEVAYICKFIKECSELAALLNQLMGNKKTF